MTRTLIFALILALFAGQVFGAVDDAYTKALLHFDADFTDEAGNYWDPYGDLSISTSEMKFGAGSFNGGNGANQIETVVEIPIENTWTIDFWVKFKTSGAVGIFDFWGDGYVWNLTFFRNAENGYTLLLNGGALFYSSGTLADTNWHHFAIIKSGTTVTLYLDGKGKGSAEMAYTTTISKSLSIGSNGNLGKYLDEFRLSAGIARWSSDFDLPTAAYGPAAPVAERSGLSFASGGMVNFSGVGSIGLR